MAAVSRDRRPLSSNLKGMLMMLGASLVLTSMHGAVRYVSAGMHPFEVAFFRNLFGLLTVMPLLVRGGWGSLRSQHPWWQLLRGLFGLCAMLSWFYGLSVVPLAEATALSFSAAIFGSLGAALFLGERMRARRWSAVLFGFIGALIILRPGIGVFQPGALVVLFASLGWAAALLTVKHLSRSDGVLTIVGWSSILLTVFSLPPALLVWTAPSAAQLWWLLLIGSLATLGHLAMTSAFKLADASAVFPIDFTRLLWASAIGLVAFGEWPDRWTWIGGSVIFASTAYIGYRESLRRRQAQSIRLDCGT